MEILKIQDSGQNWKRIVSSLQSTMYFKFMCLCWDPVCETKFNDKPHENVKLPRHCLIFLVQGHNGQSVSGKDNLCVSERERESDGREEK